MFAEHSSAWKLWGRGFAQVDWPLRRTHSPRSAQLPSSQVECPPMAPVRANPTSFVPRGIRDAAALGGPATMWEPSRIHRSVQQFVLFSPIDGPGHAIDRAVTFSPSASLSPHANSRSPLK